MKKRSILNYLESFKILQIFKSRSYNESNDNDMTKLLVLISNQAIAIAKIQIISIIILIYIHRVGIKSDTKNRT